MSWSFDEWNAKFLTDWQKEEERRRKAEEKAAEKNLFNQKLGAEPPKKRTSIYDNPMTHPFLTDEEKMEKLRSANEAVPKGTEPDGYRNVGINPLLFKDPGGGLFTGDVTDEALDEAYDPQTARGKAARALQMMAGHGFVKDDGFHEMGRRPVGAGPSPGTQVGRTACRAHRS